MTSRRLAVVSAGLSTPSSTRLLADRLSMATATQLRDAGVDVAIDTIDLRDHATDLAKHLLTGFAGPELAAALRQVIDADGLIAATPVFSASYSGLFKTFFDVIEEGALADLPVLVAATAGTARHSLVLDYAMRPLFTYLKAVVVPTGVFAATEDWGTSGGAVHEGLARRVDRGAGELARLILASKRAAGGGELEVTTPFDQLLAGRASRQSG